MPHGEKDMRQADHAFSSNMADAAAASAAAMTVATTNSGLGARTQLSENHRELALVALLPILAGSRRLSVLHDDW